MSAHDAHVDRASMRGAVLRALELGRSARLTAPPNPWVGCVILNDGVPVGEGHTALPGGDHAEVAALKAAGARARGGVAVVSLEPCAHHGRTGPCADALTAAGIARVVFVLRDPDPRVNGAGEAGLRASGIPTECLEDSADPADRTLVDQAQADLAPYLWHRSRGMPWVIAKIGMSLDAKVAALDGSSQWITGPQARRDAHQLRAASGAILVGAKTANADHPSLTVRDVELPANAPLRVVLDGSGRTEPVGPLSDMSLAPTMIVTTPSMDPARVSRWQDCGAEVLCLPSADGRVDLLAMLEELAQRGVLQLMIEGGGHTIGGFYAAGLLQALRCYIAPTLLGTGAGPAFAVPGIETITAAERMNLVSVERFGDDVRLEFRI